MDATRCLDDLDKDFKYKYANDSHSWIIDYPGSLKADPNSLKISSKNETYTEHDVRRQGTKGKRKKLMEAFYRKVISEEMLAQLEDESITVEEYLSDYMESFKNPDDMPLPGETLSKNEKLKKETGSNESAKQSDLEETHECVLCDDLFIRPVDRGPGLRRVRSDHGQLCQHRSIFLGDHIAGLAVRNNGQTPD